MPIEYREYAVIDADLLSEGGPVWPALEDVNVRPFPRWLR